MAILVLICMAVLIFCLRRKFVDKGNRGERKVARALSHGLDPEKYKIISDLIIPDSAGGTTQIDHVVISQYGIFVIETKNWSGWIFGDFDCPKWTEQFYRKKYLFQNPFRQNYKHIVCLSRFTGLPFGYFISVVAVVGKCKIKARERLPDSFVTGCIALLAFIKEHREPIPLMESPESIYNDLLSRKDMTDRRHEIEHIRRVKRITAPSRPDADPICPRCGSPMVLRRAKKGAYAGKDFWGCSRYPKCRGIVKVKRKPFFW